MAHVLSNHALSKPGARRILQVVGGLLCVTLVWCSPARAEPITVTVTSGRAEFLGGSPGGTIAIFGDHGFSLLGDLSSTGSFEPRCCVIPGTTISFGGMWTGLDLQNATATFDGFSFDDVGGSTSPTAALVEFSSIAATVPALNAGGATIQAPFVLRGLFKNMTLDERFVDAVLVGQGMGTLTLRPNPVGFWETSAAQFDFARAPVTVPEPSLLLLLGIGAVGWHRGRRAAPNA